jgi:hypothetical protein
MAPFACRNQATNCERKNTMTQTTHTPGPWRVFDAFVDLEIVSDRPTANATESLVQFKGQRNAKANARLMAAAPELLEALKNIDFHIRQGKILERDACITQARAAIAKAEGGAA